MNAKQLRELVVRPTLEYLQGAVPYSKEAEDLLMMTAAHESHLGEYLKQINGPALGIYQMEPRTEEDIWRNYLYYREPLNEAIQVTMKDPWTVDSPLLVCDLVYATAMARVHYFRVPEALPQYDGTEGYIDALARYAKKYYNTEKGKATVQDYKEAYLSRCAGSL